MFLLLTICNLLCQNKTNVPHDFVNVELLLPVFFYARDMTHPYNSHHHSRHFYRRKCSVTQTSTLLQPQILYSSITTYETKGSLLTLEVTTSNIFFNALIIHYTWDRFQSK